jgi:integrase
VRTLALVPGALDALARLRDVHDALRARLGDWQHDLVLLAHDGTPVKPERVTKRWKRLLDAAGLRQLRLHDARHTHGTVLADAGVPVHAISARMGHASVATTMHFYVHAGEAADRRAALTMAEVLQASVGSNLVAERRETGAHGDGAQRRNAATTPPGEREKRRDSGDDGTRT